MGFDVKYCTHHLYYCSLVNMLPLAIAVGALLLILAGVAAFLKQSGNASARQRDGAQPQEVDVGAPARGLNRPGGGARRRRRRAAASDEEDEEQEQEQHAEPAPRQFTARDAYEARRAAREAEREAQEAAQEEEIRRAAEERQRREEEEAAKWMHLFSVEAAGEEVLSQADGQALEARMVEYVKRRKTVALDELAAEFGLRTQAAIKRLQELEASGSITGVMDDRGKFIFISLDEMQAVADFIRRRGRIGIAELAAKSDQFVDLEAKPAALDAEFAAAIEAGA